MKTNFMKKSIFAAFLMLLGTFSFAQTQFGAGVSLALDSPTAFGVQGKVLHNLDAEKFGIAGDFTYFFEDFTYYALNANATYDLAEVGDGIRILGTAGLNYSRISVLGFGSSDIGLNIGANFLLELGGMNVYAEPKFVLGDGSNLIISGGLLF